ncbi:metallophosphoesterase family protein [Methanosarcina siciliae]|nr:metallophosphoesterase [Methanosarcina siciliae]
MRLVHLSDIHFSEAFYMPEIADAMLEKINQDNPDIVVITGDLTENGLAAEYNGAKNFIDRIGCKNKVIVPGNHDSRNAGYLFFEDIFKARSSSGSFGEVVVVGLDSSQPELEEGHIGRENYGWIEKAFSTPGLKVFALHHHLIPIPRTGRGNNVLVDAGDVLELLDHSGVNLVLCGHWHIPWVWRLNDMLVVSAGTVCSSKVRGKASQCYNYIEIAAPEPDCTRWHLQVHRVFYGGKKEKVVDSII